MKISCRQSSRYHPVERKKYVLHQNNSASINLNSENKAVLDPCGSKACQLTPVLLAAFLFPQDEMPMCQCISPCFFALWHMIT